MLLTVQLSAIFHVRRKLATKSGFLEWNKPHHIRGESGGLSDFPFSCTAFSRLLDETETRSRRAIVITLFGRS